MDAELVPDHQLRLVSGRIVRKDAGPKQDERLLIGGLVWTNRVRCRGARALVVKVRITQCGFWWITTPGN